MIKTLIIKIKYFTIWFWLINIGFEGSINVATRICFQKYPIFASDESIDFFPEPKIHPNPTNHYFTIDLTRERGSYSIYDLNGRLMDPNLFDGSATVNVSNWSSGIFGEHRICQWFYFERKNCNSGLVFILLIYYE